MSTTHFVVLAAGKGSRLASAGHTTPKWLLSVGGHVIADRQLEGIAHAARLTPTSISVIAGYRADLISKYADEVQNPLNVVVNPHYETRNNWYSLLLAFESLAVDMDDRVVVMNSDLCADPEWFMAVITGVLAAGSEVLAVDSQRALTDEAMKVSATVNGQQVQILEAIGKTALREPCGEYVGLLALSSSGVKVLRQELERFVHDSSRANDWYEAAIGHSAAKMEWILHPVPDSGWTEIDDPADLAIAESQ